MKQILVILALALVASLPAPPAQAQPQQLQLVASDTINCATAFSTLRLDSLIARGTGVKTYDSTGYNDWRFIAQQKTPVQLEIHVRTTGGRADTLVLRQYERGAWIDGVGYDTVSVPVPAMDLSTASVDTLMIVDGGPVASFKGQWYRHAKFLVYSAFMDQHVWVIERKRSVAHISSHKVIIDIYRRYGYAGGQ